MLAWERDWGLELLAASQGILENISIKKTRQIVQLPYGSTGDVTYNRENSVN